MTETKHDLSAAEVVDLTINAGTVVATAASLLPSGGASGAAIGVGLLLAGKSWDWFTRNAKARSESWWQGFLDGCRDGKLSDVEIEQQLRERLEHDENTGDLVMENMRAIMNAADSEAVRILGFLRGAYYRDGKKPDLIFRALTDVLMQSTESDLFHLRMLIGRLACVESLRGLEEICVETTYDERSGRYRQAVSALEESRVGRPQRPLGAAWGASGGSSEWLRLRHLLTISGLARHGGHTHELVFSQLDVHYVHRLLKKHGVQDGEYRYYVRGGSGTYRAELENLSQCLGYGTSADAALDMLRDNMTWFVDDAKGATLVQRPPPRPDESW